MLTHFIPLLGIATILLVAFLLSKKRSAISCLIVAWGLGLQILVALFVLRTQAGYWLLEKVSGGFVTLLNYSFAGSSFVFGPLSRKGGPFGVIFAFQALPMIIYIASLSSILYYLRVLPMLVFVTGKLMLDSWERAGRNRWRWRRAF